MRGISSIGGRSMLLATAAALMFAGSAFGQVGGPDPCIVDDDGSGTVVLPPEGCEYLSPTQVHEIIDGLPLGTTIELAPIHLDFICREQGAGGGAPLADCTTNGGPLGGQTETFESTLRMKMTGTGDLSTFSRTIDIPMFCVMATALRGAGPVQTFATEIFACQGDLFGDPDFDTLTIRAGSALGLPSPGITTLTDQGDGTWAVDSFFDITYTIDYQGSPGGELNGATGSDQFTIHMEAHAIPPIPTVSEWGLMGMTVLLVGAGAVVIQRRRRLA